MDFSKKYSIQMRTRFYNSQVMINQLVLPIVLAKYMRIVWTKEIRNSKFELFSTSVFWLELERR